MKTTFFFLLLFFTAIGGQTIPTNKPIGTNPGHERRLADIGGTQSVPRTSFYPSDGRAFFA
ncbi:hypothetical protein [Flavobacterium sp.]|uniref:hypothetical protein n=1 Tax=Flavobacterium sp. TaxID=239 RepID=UPI0039E71202